MAKVPRHAKIGFDSEFVLDALLGKLVAAGGLASNDPRLSIWSGPQTPELEAAGEDYRILTLIHLGGDHQRQHGMQKGGPICKIFPCRVAGLSGAVSEIASYLIQAKDQHGLIALSDAIDDFRAKPAMLFALLNWFLDIHKDHHDRTPALRYGPRLALGRIDALMESLNQLQVELHAPLESPQFDQSDQGRPAEHLLTAVYQHLRLTGGLSLEEIALIKLERTDAVLAGSEKEQLLASKIEAIAKRVKSADVRTWHPYRGRTPPETIPPGHSFA